MGGPKVPLHTINVRKGLRYRYEHQVSPFAHCLRLSPDSVSSIVAALPTSTSPLTDTSSRSLKQMVSLTSHSKSTNSPSSLVNGTPLSSRLIKISETTVSGLRHLGLPPANLISQGSGLRLHRLLRTPIAPVRALFFLVVSKIDNMFSRPRLYQRHLPIPRRPGTGPYYQGCRVSQLQGP